MNKAVEMTKKRKILNVVGAFCILGIFVVVMSDTGDVILPHWFRLSVMFLFAGWYFYHLVTKDRRRSRQLAAPCPHCDKYATDPIGQADVDHAA